MPRVAGGRRPIDAEDPLRRLAGAALLVAAVLPGRATTDGPVLCPVRRATGLPCPACGLTRSTGAMLHGDLARSVAWHPLGPVAVVAVTAFATGHAAEERRAGHAATAAGAALVAAWLVTWAIRLSLAARRRS